MASSRDRTIPRPSFAEAGDAASAWADIGGGGIGGWDSSIDPADSGGGEGGQWGGEELGKRELVSNTSEESRLQRCAVLILIADLYLCQQFHGVDT